MGSQLVKQAFAFGARHPLKANERSLLLWMAHTALDTDARPRYFAAREQSAIGIGRMVPDEPDPGLPDAPEIRRVREAAFQAVKVATAGLVKHGAVRSVTRGRTGHRAEYELTLGQLPPPVSKKDQG